MPTFAIILRMPERNAGNPIVATQNWMEEFIVDKKICPPFVRLAKDFRTADGKLDWGQLSRVVITEDATHLDTENDALLPFLLEKYLGFLEQVNNDTAPMAFNITLPDFEKNEDFEYLVRDIKTAALLELIATPTNRQFTKDLFRKIVTTHQIPLHFYQETLQAGPTAVAIYVIEGGFDPVFFHGKPLSDSDLADTPDTDGPQERYRILSRAPYYTIQFLNVVGGSHLSANLNRETMHGKNNETIAGIDMELFEAQMTQFKAPQNQ